MIQRLMAALAVAAACLTVPAAALALSAPPHGVVPLHPAVAPAVWVVDHAASKVVFTSAVSGQAFTGGFKRWDAAIRFDPKDLAHSSVSATFDLTSIFTGNADRDAALPDQDWLWTSHFRNATFVSNGFRQTGPNAFLASGVLTLKGNARPLAFPFTLAITGPLAKMNAQFVINRLSFAVGQGDFQATDTVPANITVGLALVAHRTP